MNRKKITTKKGLKRDWSFGSPWHRATKGYELLLLALLLSVSMACPSGGSSGDGNGGGSNGGPSGPLTLSGSTEINGATEDGPTLVNEDFFGSSIANLGDLDGGGGTVIAVGAAGDNTGGTSRGAIYLLSYNASGTLTGTTKVASGTQNAPTLANGNAFGPAIANLGDLDGGGGTVIVVGANGDNTGGTNRGAVHLLSYNVSGVLSGATKVASGTPDGPTLADSDLFGGAIANAGDLGANGGTTIVVGAILDSTGGLFFQGAIHLLAYNASGALTGTTKIASGTPNGPTLVSGDSFGSSIANLGDLDGGGGTVIAVGAAGDDSGGSGRGAIHLLSYNASGTLSGTTKIASGTPNGPTLANEDGFGSAIANVGDLDRNGGTVIVVGASGDDSGGTSRGAIHLLSYDSSGALTGTTKIASGTTNGPTLADSDLFGDAIANAGDLGGNGGMVIAVGADRDDSGGTDRGAIHLLEYR